MARIAVGGFQHETNTFAPLMATLADFEQADALARTDAAARGCSRRWPGSIARGGLHRGSPLARALARSAVVVLGAAFGIREARRRSRRSRNVSSMSSRQRASLDAVYLDLHGAMVAEHIEDARSAKCWRACAQSWGRMFPVVASLDFRANVSARMVAQADGLVSYRSLPTRRHDGDWERVRRHSCTTCLQRRHPRSGTERCPISFRLRLNARSSIL